MILNIGYESFDSGILLDHRGMYMDVDLQALQTNPEVYSQRMRSNQSTRVKKYRKNLIKKLNMKRIMQQIKKLTKISRREWKRTHTNKLRRLDKIIMKAMLDAE